MVHHQQTHKACSIADNQARFDLYNVLWRFIQITLFPAEIAILFSIALQQQQMLLWSACYPIYTEKKRKKTIKNVSIFCACDDTRLE